MSYSFLHRFFIVQMLPLLYSVSVKMSRTYPVGWCISNDTVDKTKSVRYNIKTNLPSRLLPQIPAEMG